VVFLKALTSPQLVRNEKRGIEYRGGHYDSVESSAIPEIHRAAVLGSALPFSIVKVAFGTGSPAEDFRFGYISDAHIQHLGGPNFVRTGSRADPGGSRANLLTPKPDFFFFGGDLAQLGTKDEIDHGLEIMSKLQGRVHYVMGEHDYYLDLGEYWESKLGPSITASTIKECTSSS